MGRMNRTLEEYMTDAELYKHTEHMCDFMNHCHTLKSAVNHFCSLDKATPAHYAKLYASVIYAIKLTDEKLEYVDKKYGKVVKLDIWHKNTGMHDTEPNLQLTDYGMHLKKAGLRLRKELQTYLGMLDKKFNEQFVRRS